MSGEVDLDVIRALLNKIDESTNSSILTLIMSFISPLLLKHALSAYTNLGIIKHLKSSMRLFTKDMGDIYDPFPPAAEINPTSLSVQDWPVNSIKFFATAFKS